MTLNANIMRNFERIREMVPMGSAQNSYESSESQTTEKS